MCTQSTNAAVQIKDIWDSFLFWIKIIFAAAFVILRSEWQAVGKCKLRIQ